MTVLKAKVSGEWVPVVGSDQDAANVAHWNSAWGVVATATRADFVNVTVSNTVILTAPFTAVEGRVYSAQFWAVGQYGVINSVVHNILRLDNGAVTRSDQRYTTGAINEQITFNTEVPNFTTTAGSHSMTLEANFTGAGGVKFQGDWLPMRLVVSDVGPVAPVSIAPPTAGPRVVASGNALGVVAVGSLTGQMPMTFTANAPANYTNPINFTPQIGRRYRLKANVRAISSTSPVDLVTQVFDGTTRFGTEDRHDIINGSYISHQPEFIFDGDGVARSFILQGTTFNGSASAYLNDGNYYLEDIGPNSAPALPIPETAPAWTPLALAPNWSSWSDASYVGAGIRKIGDIVTLRGLITNQAGATTLLCTLPVGFRPPARLILPVSSYDSWAQVEIGPNGTVTRTVGGATFAPAIWVSLSNISFSVTA
jgi:hypothetical protein